MRTLLPLVLVVLALACGGASEDLAQAETAYEAAKYDEARVWLADLERNVTSLDAPGRARYYYYSGMVAYRLGKRDDALHFLALAREVAGEERSGNLDEERRATLTRTLDELTPTSGTFHAREAPSEGSSTTPAAEGGGSGAEAAPETPPEGQ